MRTAGGDVLATLALIPRPVQDEGLGVTRKSSFSKKTGVVAATLPPEGPEQTTTGEHDILFFTIFFVIFSIHQPEETTTALRSPAANLRPSPLSGNRQSVWELGFRFPAAGDYARLSSDGKHHRGKRRHGRLRPDKRRRHGIRRNRTVPVTPMDANGPVRPDAAGAVNSTRAYKGAGRFGKRDIDVRAMVAKAIDLSIRGGFLETSLLSGEARSQVSEGSGQGVGQVAPLGETLPRRRIHSGWISGIAAMSASGLVTTARIYKRKSRRMLLRMRPLPLKSFVSK